MERPKRISIKDIAKHVGVSTALVSYILNGLEKEKRVNPELVIKVREAVALFNYTPNHFARSLRTGNTMTIGLIVADIANPFFSNLSRFIEDEAFKQGYTVIIGSSNEEYSISESLIKAFTERQVDGFIIVPSEKSENLIQKLVLNSVPFVLLDRYFPKIDTNYVILDNFNASYNGVKHLVANSHSKIGMIAYKSSMVHMKDRIKGYLSAMKDSDLDEYVHVEEIRYSHLKEDVAKCIKLFTSIENKYDALIVATNSIAVASLYELNEKQIHIPEDLALVCFDSSEAFDFFYSPITYIKQPLEEMGRSAVNMLISKIKTNADNIHMEIKHDLVIRESSR